ncbi:sugar dehydrogenase complex small subunit [Azospirillum sp.]|uniref:sugar dehydrogenase complex small subunit n=1 Tax=Azospirillum sp. TaxID=34012 RepID=UPI002D36B709|nr:sugar dehydrogenase complex small subunit [Azospirillum sp.]HYD65427.1 sugar dehydrogenase complex small subunit [Azospirillum sp.]
MPDSPPRRPAEPTRRDVLAGMAGVAAVAVAPTALMPTAAAAADAKSILKASATLTGIPLDLSYLDLAQKVWDTLAPTYGAPVLEKLVQAVNTAPPQRPLKDVLLEQGLLPAAQAVTSTWYTGASAADGGQTVLFYNDALMWRSCAFTKPPATCGGTFGYWEQAYEPVAAAKPTGKA